MIDARTQADFAADARATGWKWYAQGRDGSGNVRQLQPVSWEQAVLKLAALTGWVLVKEEAEGVITGSDSKVVPIGRGR